MVDMGRSFTVRWIETNKSRSVETGFEFRFVARLLTVFGRGAGPAYDSSNGMNMPIRARLLTLCLALFLAWPTLAYPVGAPDCCAGTACCGCDEQPAQQCLCPAQAPDSERDLQALVHSIPAIAPLRALPILAETRPSLAVSSPRAPFYLPRGPDIHGLSAFVLNLPPPA